LKLKETADKAIFDALAERNARVQLPRSRPESTQQSAQQRALQLFDSIHSSHDVSSASMTCLNSVEDKPALVAKLLEWSATPFRSGLCRIYTAARLLRKWKMSGVDIDSYIILFLSTVEDTAQVNMDNIYHVISELVRSQTFSISKYLQWLMAKGVTKISNANNDKVCSLQQFRSIHAQIAQVMSSDVALLTQLPMGRLPEHVRNLRHTLLTRAGLCLTDECSAIESLKSSISQRLPNMFPGKYSNTVPTTLSNSNLTWAVKSEVSMWVRQGVAKHTRDIARSVA
jgi:mediator of RNA polymerase II transcription subunit 12